MALLEIRNLQKKFYAPDGTVTAVISVPQLSLEAGSSLIIEGPSGSGKTTLLHIISGLLKADEGSIIFAGQELTKFTAKAMDAWRAANIGYVFQKLNLLDALTVEENILLAAKWHKSKNINSRTLAAERLQRVGREDMAGLFPHKHSFVEQQRVAVVRALLNKPRLLLADEPTASLDKDNAAKVLHLLQEMCSMENVALLLSTHDEAVKQQFARRYNIRSGKINE